MDHLLDIIICNSLGFNIEENIASILNVNESYPMEINNIPCKCIRNESYTMEMNHIPWK